MKRLLMLAASALIITATGCGQDTMSRDDFRNAVISKSKEEVIDSVGKPDSTSGDTSTPNGELDVWFYRNRTQDPITGEVDVQTSVMFRNGTADRVSF